MITTDEHCSRSFYVGCWGNIISNLRNCELWRTRVSRHTHGARGARMLHVLCSKFVVATTLGSSTRIGGAWAIPIGCIVWWVAGTSNNWSRVSYSCLWAFDLRSHDFWEEHYSLTSSMTFLCAAKGDSQLIMVQSKHPMGISRSHSPREAWGPTWKRWHKDSETSRQDQREAESSICTHGSRDRRRCNQSARGGGDNWDQGPPTLAVEILTVDDSREGGSQCSFNLRFPVGQHCFRGRSQTCERRNTAQNKIRRVMETTRTESYHRMLGR